MNVFIVYCHPSKDSFTYAVKESFIKGLILAGHTFEISDLYAMDFDESMTESEYAREGFYQEALPLKKDVSNEQRKIQNADVIVFIYPVFWTEAPAKLVGWFQRVWTYGFAYGNKPTMKKLEKALFLVTMGGSLKEPIRQEQLQAMKTVMLGDRIHNRVKQAEMVVFDEMTRGYGNDQNRITRSKLFFSQAYELGKSL